MNKHKQNVSWTPDNLDDIIDWNLNYDHTGEQGMLNFNSPTEVKLYTGLNSINLQKLKNNQYTDVIIAFEYPEIARKTIKQAEYLVEVAYDTKGMFDLIHPDSYITVNKLIADNKLKKSEIKDGQIIRELLNKGYTGVRAIKIDTSQKCYSHTKTAFAEIGIVYELNSAFIKILQEQKLR